MRISEWRSDVCSSDLLAAELLQRRQRAVALAEALHAPTLRIDADQLRARRGLADRGRQLGHLRPGGEVALEQDHAGAGVVLQPVALLGIQFGAGDADHEHGRWTSGMTNRIVAQRSEEHTSELQSLMRISYAVFCLNKKKKKV